MRRRRIYVRGKRLQKGSTHSSSSALQQRRTDGRRHTREATDTGACDYTARSWKGRRNEKGGKIVAYFSVIFGKHTRIMAKYGRYEIGELPVGRKLSTSVGLATLLPRGA